MDFTINRHVFSNVLAKVQGLTGRKTNLAITTNVLIKAKGSQLSVIATDLETGFEGYYSAEIKKEGSAALNARKLFEIVREFPDELIRIHEVENYWIKIGRDKVDAAEEKQLEFNIVGMNPDDFPDIPEIEEVQFFNIDPTALNKMIERTVIITASPDDKRAHFIGIYLEIIEKDDKKLLRMVSTDGSRLSTADHIYDKNDEIPINKSILIPKKGINEVTKFLDDEKLVQLGVKDNNFIIKKNSEKIIIRLLEGDFPDYIDITTKKDVHTIKMDKNLFLMMLKRMSILASDDYKGVIFTFDKDKLKIDSTNPEIGESREDIIIDYNGDNVEAMFNPRFFIETINVIDDEKILLSISSGEKPCIIEAEKDKTYLSVIMPMKI
ncbi:MAG: DNA polymerase III subunit beta [Thermodesulfobacteriota bacterium]|nr:DNA polymerase III subunit beta [Thermodesulfobacteriota bacterium]